MNNKELPKIIENLETVFRGDAWHGPSIMEVLKGISPNLVNQKTTNTKYTIAQNVFHLIAWREFLIQKLNGNFKYELITELENWGNNEDVSVENWPNLIANLQAKQEKIVELLENSDDSLLHKTVPGNDFNFYHLLTGFIQHDTFHLGMIWILW
jgi:uncharacterized damage-inducible protein DinB